MKSITIDLTEGKLKISIKGNLEAFEILGALEQAKILFTSDMLKNSYNEKDFEKRKKYLLEFLVWIIKQSKSVLNRPTGEVINLFMNRENEI